MSAEIQGVVTFANGLAAPGVQVRVFDEDAPGKGDDDLTLTPGVSDAQGRFTVSYDPGRFRDFITIPFLGMGRGAEGGSGIRVPDLLDILSPYLQFQYKVAGEEKTLHVALKPFENRFTLPETPEIHFLPSQNGFLFPNLFPGLRVPFTVPFLPEHHRITGDYGLCGGMSAAAADYFLCGQMRPQGGQVPGNRSRLFQYLFRRAMDSFAMGQSIIRFAQWMALPDDGPNGVQRMTLAEFEKLRAALTQNHLVPIGLVISTGSSPSELAQWVWSNHQVLAYGQIENEDGSVDIRVYDPNSPGRDDAQIHTRREILAEGPDGKIEGIVCQPVNVNISPLRVRGFFLMPYHPELPPARIR